MAPRLDQEFLPRVLGDEAESLHFRDGARRPGQAPLVRAAVRVGQQQVNVRVLAIVVGDGEEIAVGGEGGDPVLCNCGEALESLEPVAGAGGVLGADDYVT